MKPILTIRIYEDIAKSYEIESRRAYTNAIFDVKQTINQLDLFNAIRNATEERLKKHHNKLKGDIMENKICLRCKKGNATLCTITKGFLVYLCDDCFILSVEFMMGNPTRELLNRIYDEVELDRLAYAYQGEIEYRNSYITNQIKARDLDIILTKEILTWLQGEK